MTDMLDNELVNVREEEVIPPEQNSQILNFFDGTIVFLTGATGFLGRLILEKLLRTCTGIKRIYIIIREKKGKTVKQRYEELFDIIIFDYVKREHPNFLDKVILLEGDCVLPNLGLSRENQEILMNEVHCVFHCAATVRFDQKLRTSTYINVRATKDLLNMSKRMKNLKSFVHVSTAYSFCVRKEIGEEFYEPLATGDKLLDVVEVLSDNVLERITPAFIGDWPNTYAFTKAVAEEVVKTYGSDLPVAIVRPSVVIGSVKEPLPGWIDNVYGATGVFVGAALGLIRTLHCDKNLLADMVPADFVVNCTIASAWYANKRRQLDVEHKEPEPIIYNYVVSNQKPLTWGETMQYVEKSATEIPSPLEVWHYCFRLNSNYWVHYLSLIFLHRIPAYIVDFLARCIGKEPVLVKGYQRIEKFLDVISYFSTKEWKFRDDNTQALWKKLNKEDKDLFNFDLDSFEWGPFFSNYARGGRMYLLKDPMETVPQGKIKYRKLQVAHYTLVTLVLLGLLKLLITLWNFIF